MSGGLDSSVVAGLYGQQGRSAIGLSMLLWDGVQTPRNGRCCGALDLGDARVVAEQVGLPHYTLRLDEEFRELVVDPFVTDYLNGRTPSPCVRCNTFVKFDLLLERAASLGCERVATGHYARIRPGTGERAGELELHRARDLAKDQSYYLFELNQKQLAAIEFPLGELTKDQVRQMAREIGLVVAEKGESMEVCFVGGSIRDFVEEQIAARPEHFAEAAANSSGVAQGVSLAESGQGAEVVSEQGELLGRADPYYRYTIGQRKGLGISSAEPLYVLGVEPAANRVVVGGRRSLESTGLLGERLHWIGAPPPGEVAATVRIRSRHEGVAATIVPLAGGRVAVEFAEPQSAVTPGQAAVFYDGDRVLGGCWIEGPLDAPHAL
jgi:tRNA-specific 2-thiouridylase